MKQNDSNHPTHKNDIKFKFKINLKFIKTDFWRNWAILWFWLKLDRLIVKSALVTSS